MGIKLKKIASVATGGLIGGGLGASIMGLGGLGGFKDLLLGKKQGLDVQQIPIDPDIKRTQDQARELQREGMTSLKQNLGDPGQLARQGIARESGALMGGFGDARRRLQSLIAARGLSRSGMGIGQEIGLAKEQSKQLGSLQASLPERIRQLQLQNTQNTISAAGQVLSRPGEFITAVGDPPQRQGGLLPLITAGVGGYFGGLPGAKFGYGAGQYGTGMFG